MQARETLNRIQVSDNRFYLFENNKKKEGGQAAIYQARYIENGLGDCQETNALIKSLPRDLKKQMKEVNFLQRFGLKVESAFDETHSYIVMENYGLNLLDFIRSSPVSMSERFQIILALLNEVQFLEQQNIYHRDLKLENICINRKFDELNQKEFYVIHIIDFGYACFAKPGKDKKGGEKGTFVYFPPDEKIDFASDRYALGPIIAVLLGCNLISLFRERLAAHLAYERLSKQERAQYNMNTLPGYDFNALPRKLYPENSKLRQNLLHVLSTLVDPSPRMRYGVVYLLRFFQEVYKASLEEENKGSLDLVIESASAVKNGVARVFEWMDDGLEKWDNMMCGNGKWKNRSRKNKPEEKAADKTANPFYQTDYCALTEETLKGSPEYYFQNLARYRDKFKGTNSDGIIRIFDEMEAAGDFEDKIEKTSAIARAKQTPPLISFGCFANTRRPRHLNIDVLYGKFAQLQPGDYGNFERLNDIEQDFKTLTFV